MDTGRGSDSDRSDFRQGAEGKRFAVHRLPFSGDGKKFFTLCGKADAGDSFVARDQSYAHLLF